ncbi:MAG: nitrilase-related carbon-nitrogen hydrolase [bacterium]
MSETIKTIGYGQFLPIFEDIEGNIAQIERIVRETGNVDLLVFPELATSGYEFLNVAELATMAEEFIEGQTSCRMKRLARETGTTVVIGYPEQKGQRFFNSSMLATPDGTLMNYRKIHLYDRENDLFSPGDEAPKVVDTPAGRVGMMICFDWTFPETARLLALAGVQIIAHPSNLVMPYCQRAMFARCLENSVYVVTANRVGTEQRVGRSLTFTGQSQITGPRGDILASGSADKPEIATVEVDLSVADEKSYNSYNHRFRDRRVELYGALLNP